VKLQLNLASEADIPEIFRLAEASWQAHYPAIIGQEQVDYMLARFYNDESLLQQMRDGQRFYFIEIDSVRAGFVAISSPGKHFLAPDSHFIHKFYLHPSQQNRGVGAAAFEALARVETEAQHIRLQVNRQNFKPINFYFKLGFRIESIGDFSIGDGYEMNDFVMVWTRS
jgi:ribosomal protein S18 acetylase RimI-like enzyme